MERIEIIDSAKGLGILCLITITHNFFLPDYLLNIDGYILMPFFFFLNGMVFKHDCLTVTIKKRVISLLIPYLLFCLFGLLYKLVILKEDAMCDTFLDFIYAVFTGEPKRLLHYYMNPLWYIHALFLISILYSILSNFNNFRKSIIVFFLVILSCLLGYYKHQFIDSDSFVFNIDVVLFSLLYFHLGFLCKKMNLEKLQKWYVLLVSGFLVMSLCYLFNKRSILAYNDIPNYFIFIPVSIVGIIFLLSISSELQSNLILKKIGRFTLYILGFHWIVLHGGLYRIFYKIFEIMPTDQIITDNVFVSISLGFIFSILQLLIIYPLTFPMKFLVEFIQKKCISISAGKLR
jgi:fucose 4-O-acetylase-like acetyltransferase